MYNVEKREERKIERETKGTDGTEEGEKERAKAALLKGTIGRTHGGRVARMNDWGHETRWFPATLYRVTATNVTRKGRIGRAE